MEHYNTISVLLKSGKSHREIAQTLGISRYAVHKMANHIITGSQEVITSKACKLDDYRQEILTWLEEKKLSSLLIYERLRVQGIEISYPTVARYIKSLKGKEVYVPVLTNPGEEAQVDFGYLGYFSRGSKQVKIWVFCMVLSYSRYAYYREVTDQSISTFMRCHMEAFEFFGGVPATVKIDNLKAGVLHADFYEPVIQRQYAAFLAHYGTVPVTARIRRGQDKGKVEAGIKYVKGNFLKSLEHRHYGRLSQDLQEWNRIKCNVRIHGTTRKVPCEQFLGIEKRHLHQLPAERYVFSDFQERKVNQYGHILYQYNYYSVPYEFAGYMMQVESNGSIIRISRNGKTYAVHTLHSEVGVFVTHESHKPFHKQKKSPDYFREQMETIGANAVKLLEGMQLRQPHHWHPMAKGVISLKKEFTVETIDKACQCAMGYGAYTYQSVKNICENNAEDRSPRTSAKVSLGGYNHDLHIYDRLEGR